MHYLEKELYDRISKSDQVFDFIQNNVLDGIWYWDLENPQNDFVSPGFYKVFGYENNEDLPNSETWTTMIFPEDLAHSQELMGKHFANPDFPFEQISRYRHKNGSTVWIRCKAVAIRDEQGKPIRMIGVHSTLNATFLRQFHTDLDSSFENFNKEQNFSETEKSSKNKEVYLEKLVQSKEKEKKYDDFFIDVSERIKLINQINSKNELLELLVDKTEDAVLIFNEQLQLIFSNKQFERYIGKIIEEYPMDLSECLNFIHPDHQSYIFDLYETARLNKEKYISAQHIANHIDGKLIWLEDHVTFEYDSEGNYKRAYIVSRDITERKLIEISLENESQKHKEIAEMLVEEKEIGKEALYKNLKNSVESILLGSKNDLEESGHLDNKYIQAAYQHLVSALDEVQKIALESSSQFVFENHFVDAISNYFSQINETSKVYFEVQNELNRPIILNESQRKHLFRICQELAQNVAKHSIADKMIFRFKEENGQFILIAKDNGVGKETYRNTKGIGIKNIQNRVFLMNGLIRFFYFKKTGLAVYITLGVANN